MAYTTGTAANHVALLDALVTFLSTGLGAGENWQVLRYTGAAEIEASSQRVDWEGWRAIKGQYHPHANGWSTATGAAAPSWLRLKLVQGLDIARIKIQGSAAPSQSPAAFELQWSDDGIAWNTRQAFSGITWAANEIKEFALTGASPGAKQHWRLYVTANGGGTETVIKQWMLPVYQTFTDFNHAIRPAAWLKAPGMTGTSECFVNFGVYDSPSLDIWNIAITGATGFVADGELQNGQPGALAALALPCWNQPIQYWFAGNGQRVAITVKVDTAYMAAYAGKMLTYGTPGQYPYPLVIAAPLDAADWRRYSHAAAALPYKGNSGRLRLRGVDGTWLTPKVWPWANTGVQWRDTGGHYALLPATLYDAANTYGVLDGIRHVTGFGNAAENTVSAGTETWTVFQDGLLTNVNDYYAQRTA